MAGKLNWRLKQIRCPIESPTQPGSEGLRLSFNGASSNIKFCETFETRLRVSSNMVDLMVIRESHSNFWCDLSKLGCKIHKKLPNMFGCKHNSTELASTELSTREFDT